RALIANSSKSFSAGQSTRPSRSKGVGITGRMPFTLNAFIATHSAEALFFLVHGHQKTAHENQGPAGHKVGSQLFSQKNGGEQHAEHRQQVDGKSGAHDLHRL